MHRQSYVDGCGEAMGDRPDSNTLPGGVRLIKLDAAGTGHDDADTAHVNVVECAQEHAHRCRRRRREQARRISVDAEQHHILDLDATCPRVHLRHRHGNGACPFAVEADCLVGGTVEGNGALIENDRSGAHLTNRFQIVTDQDKGLAGITELLHALQRAFLELRITDSEDLVDQQDVRIDGYGDRKAQPDVEARRVVTDRSVEKRPNPGEVNDLVEALVDLGTP